MAFLTSINHGRNIKDIAKLRGSEDLWEVAKLHDRESAFPGVFLHLISSKKFLFL